MDWMTNMKPEVYMEAVVFLCIIILFAIIGVRVKNLEDQVSKLAKLESDRTQTNEVAKP